MNSPKEQQSLETDTSNLQALLTRIGILGGAQFEVSRQINDTMSGAIVGCALRKAAQRDYSELVAQEIDSEVRRLISEAHDRAVSILTQYRDKLDAIAQRLIEVVPASSPTAMPLPASCASSRAWKA